MAPLPMKVSIPQSYRAVLLQTPPATPICISLGNPAETALAMRVAELFSFRRAGIAITAKPVGYQGKEGIWVVALAFRVASRPAAPFESVAYLNPRRAEDLLLLQHLTKQDQLPFVFFSPHLKVSVRQAAPWSVEQRYEVRMLLARFDHGKREREQGNETDPDFEKAKAEFRRLYSVRTLLSAHPQREAHISSPFRGAVLD